MKRALILATMRLVSLLPWRVIQLLGWLLGGLLVLVPNRQRRDALINIRLCLPELDDARQRELRRRTMIEFVRTYVEMAALWLWRPERVFSLIRQESGAELFEREPDQGLIVLAPHLGAWEMVGLYLTRKGITTSMYRPQKHIDDVIRRGRQRTGARLVPDGVEGVKGLYRALKKGEIAGILPDQVTREEKGSVFAPFFGVPAVTMLLASGLARRTGAKLVYVFAERLPFGKGFHLHCISAPAEIAAADDLAAATALNRGVEGCIRIAPAQYHWTYRRFRRRPGDAPSPYTGPSI